MESNLVLAPGPAGAWDDDQVFGAAVLRGRDGEWSMWYVGRDKALPRVGDLPLGRIGLAVSPDGVRWRRISGWNRTGCVLGAGRAGRFDSLLVGQPAIVREGSLLTLWYAGTDGEGASGRFPDARGFGLRIGAALSRDGRRWVPTDGEAARGAMLGRGDGTAWDSGRATAPSVVRSPDGRWRLYYLGADATRERSQIGLALSADGLAWEKVGPVLGAGPKGNFDAEGPGSASALRRGGRYWLFYEGTDGDGVRRIGIASSEDGARFSRMPARATQGAVLDPGPAGAWDEGGIGHPFVVERPDGEVWMYYCGFGKDGRYAGLGLARCEGYDLTRWDRYGEEPEPQFGLPT